MSGYVASKEELSKLLIAEGENVIGEPQGFMVSRRVAGRVTVIKMTWELLSPGLIHFFVGLKTPVPAERRAEVIALLDDFNHDPIAGFHLSERVVFSTYAFLDHEGKISVDVVKRCLALCEQAVLRRDPELAALLAAVP